MKIPLTIIKKTTKSNNNGDGLHHQEPSEFASTKPRCHTAQKNSISVGLGGDF